MIEFFISAVFLTEAFRKIGVARLELANLPLPKRALYQAELHPVQSLVRAYRVTVRADELTFGQFGAELLGLARPRKRAQVIALRVTREVIPRHGRGMKATATVSARAERLEMLVQPDEAEARLFHL